MIKAGMCWCWCCVVICIAGWGWLMKGVCFAEVDWLSEDA